MKKHFPLLLGLLVAFTTLLVSCHDNDNASSPICQITVESVGNGSVAIVNNVGTSVTILKGNSLEVVATPDEGYEFVGWFINDDNTAVSTNTTYTFTVSQTMFLVAKFRYPFVVTGSVEGHDYVDLGLPSGLKWATCNVGATVPEEFGNHYSWGEDLKKPSYTWQYYQLSDGTADVMEKYNATDGKTIIDLEDDVANSEWGNYWRIPTTEEQKELVDNCSFETISLNGVLGLKVKGPNGNCIFLPAASYRTAPYTTILIGHLRYWSSTLSDEEYSKAFCMTTFIGNLGEFKAPVIGTAERRLGYSIRPVSE